MQEFETLAPGSICRLRLPNARLGIHRHWCHHLASEGTRSQPFRSSGHLNNIHTIKGLPKTRLTWLHIDEIRPATEITITSIQSYEAAELQQLPYDGRNRLHLNKVAPPLLASFNKRGSRSVSPSPPTKNINLYNPEAVPRRASSPFLPLRLVAAHLL